MRLSKLNNQGAYYLYTMLVYVIQVYKVIAKLLANRLKIILPDIISEQQRAFVPGRLITDNILLAYECVHAINNRKKNENPVSVQ